LRHVAVIAEAGIAAPPRLLEALDMQEMAEADPEVGRRKGYFDHARDLRRASIAKARRHP
jgi:hypothetical protein